MDITLKVESVFKHFGGITPLRDKFLEHGIQISRKAIEKWKERGSIPTISWFQIEAIADSEGSLKKLRASAIVKKKAKPKAKQSDKLSGKDLLKIYEDMLMIRRFEEKAGQLYGMGMIGGFCHLYIGQEAVACGLYHSAKKNDSWITTYRDHGLMLATGCDPKEVMGELMGRVAGCSKGKGGSMHMFDLEKKFYGGHGIVGASVPLGAGIAFADKYQENDAITWTFFGDGAANQGQVYETFNMAALWKLPVVFVIENNEYAMGTSTARSSSSTAMEMCNRGEALGIYGEQVDGMDALKVYDAGKRAAEYVRSGKGPFILEMKTYRYRGHSMSDPAKYRSKEEVSDFKEKNDPIDNLKKHLIDNKHSTEDKLKKLDKEIREKVAEVVEFCKDSPEPDEGELWTDIYS